MGAVMIQKILAITLLALTMGCAEIQSPNEPSSVAKGGQNTIEYRVSGNASSVIVRHSNTIDGLTQVTTTLPYIVSFKTNKENLFLSIEATPVAFPFPVTSPFLIAQIFVNGEMFRETSSNAFTGTITVSGTWRK